MRINKKAQMQKAGDFTVLVLGVGVALLALIFMSVLGGQAYEISESDLDAIGTYTTSDENHTVLNATATSLGNTHLTANPTVEQAGVTITGNFTFDLEAGTATLTDNANNNTEFNFSYTYRNTSVSDSVKRSVISSFGALEDTGSFMPLIVTAVIIVFVLGFVLSSFLGGKKGFNGSL